MPSGSMWSSTIASGRPSRSSFSAAAIVSASSTSRPSLSRKSRTPKRIPGSSSTIRILGTRPRRPEPGGDCRTTGGRAVLTPCARLCVRTRNANAWSPGGAAAGRRRGRPGPSASAAAPSWLPSRSTAVMAGGGRLRAARERADERSDSAVAGQASAIGVQRRPFVVKRMSSPVNAGRFVSLKLPSTTCGRAFAEDLPRPGAVDRLAVDRQPPADLQQDLAAPPRGSCRRAAGRCSAAARRSC